MSLCSKLSHPWQSSLITRVCPFLVCDDSKFFFSTALYEITANPLELAHADLKTNGLPVISPAKVEFTLAHQSTAI